MQLSYQPFSLQLKYPFTIAKFSRTYTPLMLVQVHHLGFIGYGEASMVPYMGESHESATSFLQKVQLQQFGYPFNFDEILSYLDSLATGQPAIKAAIDIALHDLSGKISGQACYQMFGADPQKMPETTCTIGIDEIPIVRKKVEEALAAGFRLLKVKLGRDSDKILINTVREMCDLPLFVDANQGWSNKEKALETLHWLHAQGVLLVEQPLDKNDTDGHAWLKESSPVPIIADEALQRLADIDSIKHAYHGINIKLMKSAGMHEAFNMIKKARQCGLKILIGCMSETSIATLAAAALAPLCDWADLDGPFLSSNNPYQTPGFKNGRYVLSPAPGLGLQF